MNDATVAEQAAALECILPELMRRMFTISSDQPALDMPLGQLRACSILQSGPHTLTALGDRLAVSPSAMSQLADRLERAGLVERVTEADDRRVRHLQLSPHGAEMMRARREQRRERAATTLDRLGPASRTVLLEHLRALLDASASLPSATAPEDPVGVRLSS